MLYILSAVVAIVVAGAGDLLTVDILARVDRALVATSGVPVVVTESVPTHVLDIRGAAGLAVGGGDVFHTRIVYP
jgi:hypothetical protein